MADLKKYITKENVWKVTKTVVNVLHAFYFPPRRPTSMFDILGPAYPQDDYYSNQRRKAELEADEKKRKDQLKEQELRFQHEKEMLELKLRLKESGVDVETETKKEEG